jgi:hypothetical protein
MTTQTTSASDGFHIVISEYDTGLTEWRFYGADRTKPLALIERQVGFAWHSHTDAATDPPDGFRHPTRAKAVEHAIRACHARQSGVSS